MDSNSYSWIIDTDYSLDDQFAIQYLINKINIIAITVIGANCSQKPNIIKKKIEDDLTNKFNRPDIKVFSGADRPYINYQKDLKDDEISDPYNYTKTDYTSYLEAADKETTLNTNIGTKIANIAAVKITEYVKEYNNNLKVLSLGPLTNLSLAVLLDSSIRDKLELIITGGSYINHGNSGTCAEYNFRVDPVAAKNVINYYKKITVISLDIEDQIFEYVKNSGLLFNSLVSDVLKLNSNEDQTVQYSCLGYFAAIITCNLNCVSSTIKMPTDVDIIGRFTRGALVIEKYDYLKSGSFNEVNFIESIDLVSFVNLLKSIE